jgi:hypothetical protein
MTRRRLMTYTIIAWITGCGFYAYYYVSSVLSSPDLVPGYEQDWRFHLLVFFIFRFPFLLMALIALMVVEVWATKKPKEM